jgi:lipopolysaccharide/colanic/teichoic acid biosynthesis glycosyltransferase
MIEEKHIFEFERRLTTVENQMESFTKAQAEHNTRTETALDKLVQRSEFQPVKNVVYGAVGMILTAVVMAVVALVIVQPS